MAWAKGTATDFMEFLRNFRDYATGVINPGTHPTINQGVQVTGANATGVLTLTGNAVNNETVTINARVYTWKTALTEAKATGVLTLTANALNTETVTVGSKVYTFQTTLTNVDGNVLIGATASDSIDNLIAAIILGAGSGTLYAAATTLHPTATASAGAGDTMNVTAKVVGTSGNLIATLETLTNGSFAASTLTGGVDPVLNQVVIAGTASISIDNLIAAINAAAGGGTTYATGTTQNVHVSAAAGAGDTMDVTARISGPGGNLVTTTETMTTGSWGGATLSGGSGDRWTILANGAGMPGIPGSGMATDGEVYMSGPGSNPDDSIIVGFKTYRNAGANIFGWEMKGFTAFDAQLAFTTLPGVSPSAFAAYDDATFNVFFWVNGRRIMALARIGTTDILVHLGLVQPFGTRSQFPYPLFITGAQIQSTNSFQTNNFGHSSIPDPCQNGGWLRWVDGSWREVNNYAGSSPTRGLARVGTGQVCWPIVDPTTNPNGGVPGGASEQDLFEQFSVGSSLILSSAEIDSYQLFPCLLMDDLNLIGRVDGLFVIGGLGLNAGDTVGIIKATGTLTLTANAGNTETVVIGGKTYTFQTVLTNVDGNVLIGANASASLDNLIAAITLGAGSGTLYAAATTLHATVRADPGAGDTMIVTAKAGGTPGNSIGTTETLVNGSFGASTLTGGAQDHDVFKNTYRNEVIDFFTVLRD